MSCGQWSSLLMLQGVDDLDPDLRVDFLAHLESCSGCRRAAAAADPTVVFSLLPTEEVESEEVEDIRRIVQAMRRVRSLESSWSPRVRHGLAMGAFAALVLAAIVLVPGQRVDDPSPGVPFSGAVGLGSGLVTLPQAAAEVERVELEIELARSSRVESLSTPAQMREIARHALTARIGERVEQDLGSGYRVRFTVQDTWSGKRPLLSGFQVVRSDGGEEVSLIEADLQPRPYSPVILGLEAANNKDEQLWLLLTHRPSNPEISARN